MITEIQIKDLVKLPQLDGRKGLRFNIGHNVQVLDEEGWELRGTVNEVYLHIPTERVAYEITTIDLGQVYAFADDIELI